jgi:hypothetical protein
MVIRKMRFHEFDNLGESPERIPAQQFNLDNLVANQIFLKNKIDKIQEIIEDSADYRIFKTGDKNNGWIILENYSRQTADYVVQIKSKNWNWMPVTATQCILWRNPASPYVQNITTKIFFNYILQNYPVIMSDKLQTDNGQQFWLRQMANAINRNYEVGVANLNLRQINWYDPKNDGFFEDWIKNQKTFADPKSFKDTSMQAIRYMIKN